MIYEFIIKSFFNEQLSLNLSFISKIFIKIILQGWCILMKSIDRISKQRYRMFYSYLLPFILLNYVQDLDFLHLNHLSPLHHSTVHLAPIYISKNIHLIYPIFSIWKCKLGKWHLRECHKKYFTLLSYYQLIFQTSLGI